MWIDERRLSDVVTALTVAGLIGFWAFDGSAPRGGLIGSGGTSVWQAAPATSDPSEPPLIPAAPVNPSPADPSPLAPAPGETSLETAFETASVPAPASPIAPPVAIPSEVGPVCGDLRLAGAPLDPVVSDADTRCRIEDPVALAAVGAVTVTPSLVTSCAVAQQLAVWVEGGLADAAATRGGGAVTGLVQVAGYACRNRNNAGEGRLSEHAFGRAVDVARFTFADGGSVSVAEDWGADTADGTFLADAWTSACGPFDTVLGPESDAFHQDHFHLDVAQRSSAYCR